MRVTLMDENLKYSVEALSRWLSVYIYRAAKRQCRKYKDNHRDWSEYLKLINNS